MGWLMIKEHSEAKRRSREIDMNDVMADPIFAFGSK
jgi:hypothetical protein